jgi:hypothetical protein
MNIVDHMEILLVVHAEVIIDQILIQIHLISTIRLIFPLFQNNKVKQLFEHSFSLLLFKKNQTKSVSHII